MVKPLRRQNCWRYAFNKYAGSIRKAPASVRRSWTISAIQTNAADFADKFVKTYPKCPVISFDKLGRPMVKGKEFRW